MSLIRLGLESHPAGLGAATLSGCCRQAAPPDRLWR